MNRIRQERKRIGLTMKELAVRLSVAESTVGYWERGEYEPSQDMLKKLAQIFNVTTDYLLGIDADNKDDALKVALFGGDGEVTDEMWEEVKQFAEFVKKRKRQQ